MEHREKHRWFRLREHVYICRKCGMGKVNAIERGAWTVTFHKPDGSSSRSARTPSCEAGPMTDRYLGKYADQLGSGIEAE